MGGVRGGSLSYDGRDFDGMPSKPSTTPSSTASETAAITGVRLRVSFIGGS